MTLTITAEQRDALYDYILDRLSGIGDLWTAAEKGDFNTADRLGREFSDILQLVLSDLRWGEGTGEPVELMTPPETLRRVFARLSEATVAHSAAVEQEQQESRELERRDSLIIEACRTVLDNLDAAQPGG